MGNPYDRFLKVKTSTVVAGLTLTFGAGKFFQDQMPKGVDQLVSTLLLISYALVPLLLWLLISYVVIPLVLEQRFFRKLVLGRRYIEGVWVEWSRRPSGEEGVALIYIQPNGEGFAMSGYDHDAACAMTHSFRMNFCQMDWPYLNYCYQNTPRGSAENLAGVGAFHFVSSRPGYSGAPTRFTGSFVHGGDRGTTQIAGKKLTDEECAALENENEKRALLRRYLLEFRVNASGGLTGSNGTNGDYNPRTLTPSPSPASSSEARTGD